MEKRTLTGRSCLTAEPRRREGVVDGTGPPTVRHLSAGTQSQTRPLVAVICLPRHCSRKQAALKMGGSQRAKGSTRRWQRPWGIQDRDLRPDGAISGRHFVPQQLLIPLLGRFSACNLRARVLGSTPARRRNPCNVGVRCGVRYVRYIVS